MWHSGSDEPSRRPSAPLVWAVLLLALIVRGSAAYLRAENLNADPDGYRNYAETLVETWTFGYRADVDEQPRPSAYRPPLYPLLLADLFYFCENDSQKIRAIAVAHVLLGVATVAVVIALASRLGLGRASLAAGVLVACDPILLNQNSLVMTETLATLLAVVALYFLLRTVQTGSRWECALAGGTLALASLCRPTFFVMLAISAIALVYVYGIRQQRWTYTAVYSAVAALVLSPWVIRNFKQFGHPILATTHGGFTFYLANNPSFFQYTRDGAPGSLWEGQHELRTPPKPSGELSTAELEMDRAYYRYARAAIEADPKGFAWAVLVRVGRLWQLLPHQIDPKESSVGRGFRYAIGAWYLMMFLLALVGIWRIRRREIRWPWIWGMLLCLSFTLVHAFYWSNMRMRAPLMPFVCVLSAACFARRSVPAAVERKSSIIEGIRLLPGPSM